MHLNRAVLFFALLISSYGLLEGNECDAGSTSSCDVDQHGKTMLQAGRDFKKHDALKIGHNRQRSSYWWENFTLTCKPGGGGWKYEKKSFSPGYAAGISKVFTGFRATWNAMHECSKLEDACGAITCVRYLVSGPAGTQAGGWQTSKNCTVRASSQTKMSPNPNEYTYVKNPTCKPLGCTWTKQFPFFSGGYASGVSQKFSYEDAILECIRLGNDACKAFTCKVIGGMEKDCTVRASASLARSFSGEATFRPTSACFSTTTTTTETPQELHLAPKGAEECDYGEPVIEVNCEAAVQTLATKDGKSPARKMMVAAKQTFSCNSAWGGVPIGCSAQVGGDWTAHFKASSGESSGPSGCVRAEYQLVCVSQR